MGEYADDYYRKEFAAKFGVDPGSMYEEDDKYAGKGKRKTRCAQCGKMVLGLSDHLKDKHHGDRNEKEEARIAAERRKK